MLTKTRLSISIVIPVHNDGADFDRQFIDDLNLNFSNRLSVVLAFGLCSTLILAWWMPVQLIVASLLSMELLVINASVYQSFSKSGDCPLL